MQFNLKDYEYLRVPFELASKIDHLKEYICTQVNGRRRRKIFYNVKFEKEENDAVVELEKRLAKSGEANIPNEMKSHAELIKYIIVVKYDFAEAEKLALKALKYWQSFHTRTFSQRVLANLESGTVYMNGRDKDLRPIIVVNAHLVDWKKLNVEEFINSLEANLTIAKHIMFFPYHIENWLLFIETNGVGLFSFPYDVVKPIISTCRAQYPCTTEHTFILNPSLSFLTTYKIASSFMDPTSREKTTVVKKEDFKSAFINIPDCQLEEKYGGTMPNKTKFWPPENTIESHPFYMKYRELISKETKSQTEGELPRPNKGNESHKPLENQQFISTERTPQKLQFRSTEMPNFSNFLENSEPKPISKSLGPKDIFDINNGFLIKKKIIESQSCTEEDLDFRESLRSSIKELSKETKTEPNESAGYYRDNILCGFCLSRKPSKKPVDDESDDNLLACSIM